MTVAVSTITEANLMLKNKIILIVLAIAFTSQTSADVTRLNQGVIVKGSLLSLKQSEWIKRCICPDRLA